MTYGLLPLLRREDGEGVGAVPVELAGAVGVGLEGGLRFGTQVLEVKARMRLLLRIVEIVFGQGDLHFHRVLPLSFLRNRLFRLWLCCRSEQGVGRFGRHLAGLQSSRLLAVVAGQFFPDEDDDADDEADGNASQHTRRSFLCVIVLVLVSDVEIVVTGDRPEDEEVVREVREDQGPAEHDQGVLRVDPIEAEEEHSPVAVVDSIAERQTGDELRVSCRLQFEAESEQAGHSLEQSGQDEDGEPSLQHKAFSFLAFSAGCSYLIFKEILASCLNLALV